MQRFLTLLLGATAAIALAGCTTPPSKAGGGGWYLYEMPFPGQHEVQLPAKDSRVLRKPVHITPGLLGKLPGFIPGARPGTGVFQPGAGSRDRDNEGLFGGVGAQPRGPGAFGTLPGVVLGGVTNDPSALYGGTNSLYGPTVVDVVSTAILRGTPRNYEKDRNEITRVTVQGSGFVPLHPESSNFVNYVEVNIVNNLEAYKVERTLVVGSTRRPVQLLLTTTLARAANIEANTGIGYVHQDNRLFIDLVRRLRVRLDDDSLGAVDIDEPYYLQIVDPVIRAGSPVKIASLRANLRR